MHMLPYQHTRITESKLAYRMAKTTYLNYNIRLLLITGAFKIQTKSVFKKKLFQIWRIVMNLMILFLLLAFSVDIAQKGSENLTQVVLNYMYIIGTVTTLTRLNYFYAFDKRSEGILEQMHEFFKYQTETYLEEKDLSGDINLINKITVVWVTICTIALPALLLATLIFNSSSERILPLPLWFPYNWKISPLYELTIAYLIFIFVMMGFVMLGTDLFLASTIILTCGQFRLLGWQIKNLLYTVLVKNGANIEALSSNNDKWQEDTELDFSRMHPQKGKQRLLLEDLKLKKFSYDLLANLNQLVQFHQSLVKFCHQLEQFFSPMYLPSLILTLLADIVVIFILLTTKDLAVTLSLGFYIACVTLFLFFPCYFGHLLTEQAEALFYDVYDCPWYMCDENFKTVLKCLHLRTGKLTVLTLGKFATLSLSAFLWIVKNIISYVMVLYQLTEDNRK